MTKTIQLLMALALGLAVGLANAVWADDLPEDSNSESFERIPQGESIVLAAKVGTSNDVLGLGFDENLSQVDQSGKIHRIYQSKFKSVEENQYLFHSELLDNEFKFKAHARFLSAAAGVNFEKTKRYMIIKAYQLRRVDILETEGDPLDSAPLLAQKVYYGWAMNIIIEGSAETFTSDVAANLIQVAGGGGLQSALQTYRLKSKVHLVGLEPKEPGQIPLITRPEEIQESFKTSDKPSPIFVEYLVVKEMFSPRLPWAKAALKPGRYRLDRINLTVSDTKSNGKHWDALGDAPDPFAKVLIDNIEVATCFNKNAFKSECERDKLVDITEQSVVEMVVVDKDLSNDDYIGAARIENVGQSGHPYSDIELMTDGELTRASIVLVPVAP